MARVVTRQKEIAVGAARGARRLRRARQLLTESVLLAACGAAVGLLLASWGVELLRVTGPHTTPHLAGVRIDPRVLGFTAVIAVSAGILFGLAPALAVSKVDPHESLKEGGTRQASAYGRPPLRTVLTVAELALALVLLTGSGLLVRSFVRLTTIDLGFDPHQVLSLRVSLPPNHYQKPVQQAAFFQALLERVQSLKGVSSAAVTSVPPLMGFMMSASVEVEGQPVTSGQNLTAEVDVVSPGYFHTLGIPTLAGRTLTSQDSANAPRVAILNQSAARRFFPDQNPIGKHVRMEDQGWMSVAGIVGDVRQAGLASQASPEIFLPYLQSPDSYMTVVVHTTSDPLALAPAVRLQVERLDKDVPIFDVATMDQFLSEQVAPQRFNMLLLGVLARCGVGFQPA